MTNKKELVATMAAKSGLTQKDSELALNAMVESITEFLAKKDNVQLIGIGTFETRDRAAREGRNPQTGKKLKIKATTVPAFKAGKALRDAVK